jgi:hypothetical protein
MTFITLVTLLSLVSALNPLILWVNRRDSDTPLNKSRGFLVQRGDLPRSPHRSSSSGHLSPGVRTLASTCSRVPHGTAETELTSLKDPIWPLGENALPEEILRWLFHRFLANTVVFLPLALRQRTHRNAIWLSRYSRPILSQGAKSGNEGCPCTLLFIPGMNDQGFLKRIR